MLAINSLKKKDVKNNDNTTKDMSKNTVRYLEFSELNKILIIDFNLFY
tara:strand:+ start:110 stop:253 length:144 start_codon:yes stop_codon:yes gene_type:complete